MIRELHYDPVFDAQAHFRELLQSMARPGSLRQLSAPQLAPPYGFPRAGAALALALLDAEVGFWADPAWPELAEYLRINTGAPHQEANQADFLFLPGSATAGPWEHAKIGDPQYPEKGATLVIVCTTLGASSLTDGLGVTLTGPGIPDQQPFFIAGCSRELLTFLHHSRGSYPLGMDAIFIDLTDQVLSVPRSATLTINS